MENFLPTIIPLAATISLRSLNSPSQEALVKALIEIGKWSTVRIETMTALLPDQVNKVAKGARA